MKIIVPAMYPFPQIVFYSDKETLTVIAKLLLTIYEIGSNRALCWQMRGLDKSKDKTLLTAFTDAMTDALGDCEFATNWARKKHGLNWERASGFRPSWAAHIATHINKELNK